MTFSVTNSLVFCNSIPQLINIATKDLVTSGISLQLGGNTPGSTITLFSPTGETNATWIMNGIDQNTPIYMLGVNSQTKLLEKLPLPNYSEKETERSMTSGPLITYGVLTSEINNFSNQPLRIHNLPMNAKYKGILQFGQPDNPSDVILNSDIYFLSNPNTQSNNNVFLPPLNPIITTEHTMVKVSNNSTINEMIIEIIRNIGNNTVNFKFSTWNFTDPILYPSYSVTIQGNLTIGNEVSLGNENTTNYQIYVSPTETNLPYYYLILDNNNFLSRMQNKNSFELIDKKSFSKEEELTITTDSGNIINLGNSENKIFFDTNDFILSFMDTSQEGNILFCQDVSFENATFETDNIPWIEIETPTILTSPEMNIDSLHCLKKIILKKIPTIKNPSHYLCIQDDNTLFIKEKSSYEIEKKIENETLCNQYSYLLNEYLALEKKFLSEIKTKKILRNLFFLLRKKNKYAAYKKLLTRKLAVLGSEKKLPHYELKKYTRKKIS